MAELERGRSELGELFIEERALEMIVYGALLEVEGVYTPDRVKGGGLWDSLSRAQQGDGIHIDMVPDEKGVEEGQSGTRTAPTRGELGKRLKLELSLVAQYGIPIHKASERAIQTVRRKLQELAGAEVGEIHVKIVGITKHPS